MVQNFNTRYFFTLQEGKRVSNKVWYHVVYIQQCSTLIFFEKIVCVHINHNIGLQGAGLLQVRLIPVSPQTCSAGNLAINCSMGFIINALQMYSNIGHKLHCNKYRCFAHIEQCMCTRIDKNISRSSKQHGQYQSVEML